MLVAAAVVLAVFSSRDDASGGADAPSDDPAPVATRCTAGPPVALTFDDGPTRQHSARLARTLRRERVPATFFMVGRHVAERPKLAQRFAADGHRVLNHTYDHVDLTKRSDAQIRAQVTRAHEAYTDAGITAGHVVRPPFGSIDQRVRRVLRDLGYRTVRWTVDTNDWDDSRTADDIVRTVREGLAPRANILLHDAHDSDATMRALPRVIRLVRDRGYCFGVIDDRGKVVRAPAR